MVEFWDRFLFHIQRVLNPYYDEPLMSPLPVDLTWPCYFLLFAVEYFLCQKKKQIQYEGWLPKAHMITSNIFSVITILFFCILGYVYYLQKTDSPAVFLNIGSRDWVLLYWLYIQIYIMVGTVLLPRKKSWFGRLFWFVTFRHYLDGEVLLICTLDCLSILSNLSPPWIPKLVSQSLPLLTKQLFFLHAYAISILPEYISTYPSFWFSVEMLSMGYLYPVTILDYFWGPWRTLGVIIVLLIWLHYMNPWPFNNIQNALAPLYNPPRPPTPSRTWNIDPESNVGTVLVDNRRVEPRETTNEPLAAQAKRAISNISNISNMITKPKEDLCVICLDQPRELCIRPCHHWCLCRDCVQVLQENEKADPSLAFKRCPVCSGPVEGVFRIYNA